NQPDEEIVRVERAIRNDAIAGCQILRDIHSASGKDQFAIGRLAVVSGRTHGVGAQLEWIGRGGGKNKLPHTSEDCETYRPGPPVFRQNITAAVEHQYV